MKTERTDETNIRNEILILIFVLLFRLDWCDDACVVLTNYSCDVCAVWLPETAAPNVTERIDGERKKRVANKSLSV